MNREEAKDYARELIWASVCVRDTELAAWDRELADALVQEADGSSGQWSQGYLEAWGVTEDGEPWRVSLVSAV